MIKYFNLHSKNLERIYQNRGRIRRSKIDYLFYSLFDTIVDQYMDVLFLKLEQKSKLSKII